MRVRALHVAAGVLAILTACNTPTIPLPPPEPAPEDMVVALYELDPEKLVFSAEPVEAGARLSIPAGARVTIFDEDSGYGTLVTAGDDGRFVSDPLTGGEGDLVRIGYETEEGEVSHDLCLLVTLGRQGAANRCP
jgi:hypothetical protein